MKTIATGSQAPDFELPDHTGTPVRLSSLLEKGPVVLFFYPAAMTGGCTQETCRFRDLKTEFDSAGVQRVGISTDTVAKQKQFFDENSFDYPLLSDEDGAVATSFGVKRRFVTPVKRVTFVIDGGSTIREVISSEFNMDTHADQALVAARSL